MQFPVRCCYAMTINKSQGQTVKHVGLDLRGDVFRHGQLYVAVSRTTSRNNILCLVAPQRLFDRIPHVHNDVYPEFVQSATGYPPPFSNNRRKPNGQNSNSGNNEKSGSDDDTDSQKGNSDHENDDFNDNDYAPQYGTLYLKLATVRVYYDAFQEEYTTRPRCMSS